MAAENLIVTRARAGNGSHNGWPGPDSTAGLVASASWRSRPDSPRQSGRAIMWTVQEKRGRKIFSQGVWAPKANIAAAMKQLEAERSTEAYAKKQAAGARRREKVQPEYVVSFRDSVLEFLAFAPVYQALAERLADAIAAHATPVGSGTVARTQRIPIEQRAEAAVIAWMRHQTTLYDQ